MSESTINHETSKQRNPMRGQNIAKARDHYLSRKDGQEYDRGYRIEDAANRKPEDQLQRLDERLGKGKGAMRERAKLKSKIAKMTETEKSDKFVKRAAALTAHSVGK